MKRGLKYAFASFVCGILAATFVVAGPAPEKMELKGPAGSKEPVAFNHKSHQDKFKCGECHHGKTADGKLDPYKEGQPIAKCSSCHELGKPTDYMHKNCVGCHKEKNAGPQKCAECHKK